MTRRERLAAKAEKRSEWAESRSAKADADWDKADLSEAKSGIPLGQPILVGHHSEARHRRIIAKADNAMRRAAESSKMAAHHRQKAAGLEALLARSIFDDDPDAIEALSARIAAREEQRATNNSINKIVRRKPRAEPTPEKIQDLIGLGMTEATAKALFVPDCGGQVGIPAYVNANLSGNIKRDRDRIPRIQTSRRNQEAAEASGGMSIFENQAGQAVVTFAEKPHRDIIDALKAAGFRWGRGSWVGDKAALPDELDAM